MIYIIVAFITVLVLASLIYYMGSMGVVRVRATTTTSLYATGLLDYLSSKYVEQHPDTRIDFMPVGSGEALRRAGDGEACLVLVHAPSLEKEYIDRGVIYYHRIFAYNYFVIVGPGSDPANVANATNIVDAMKKIYDAGEAGKAKFISRGDNSGTNIRELMLWRKAGLNPNGRKWYIVSGTGMGQTLVMADQMNAYTLSDKGTYLKYLLSNRIHYLRILYSNDTALINIYSAYLVKGCNGKELERAKGFIDFIVSSRGQELIASYGVELYGEPLFYPAINKSSLADTWSKLVKGLDP